MGIVDINGKSKLIVFGGYNGSYLDSIEEWDDETKTWSMSTMNELSWQVQFVELS